jgi:hypothetical protein
MEHALASGLPAVTPYAPLPKIPPPVSTGSIRSFDDFT